MELTYYKDFMIRPKHEAGYSANAILNLCPMEYFPFKLLTRTKGCYTLEVLLLLLLGTNFKYTSGQRSDFCFQICAIK
jgi:hypothetical protein